MSVLSTETLMVNYNN